MEKNDNKSARMLIFSTVKIPLFCAMNAIASNMELHRDNFLLHVGENFHNKFCWCRCKFLRKGIKYIFSPT